MKRLKSRQRQGPKDKLDSMTNGAVRLFQHLGIWKLDKDEITQTETLTDNQIGKSGYCEL